MKIKYLGTAAAEGFPSLYCSCENCKKARAGTKKNFRSRSQAVIDGKLLLDLPCDTLWHLYENNIDILNTPHCLITHTHEDHFYPKDLNYLCKGFAHPPEGWSFNIYGNGEIEPMLNNLPERTGGILKYNKVEPFVPFEAAGYTVTALKAVHSAPNSYIYMISDGEKTLLYAHDTDIFPDETWDYLSRVKARFDLVSFDCTEGAKESLPYKGHMCLGVNIKCRDIMTEKGLIDENTVMVLNHFSHNGLNATYDEFKPIAEEKGFQVTFDGMEIEF